MTPQEAIKRIEDKITLTLNSPITEEQWDDIYDVDFEHIGRVWFTTKHGNRVEFVKASSQPEHKVGKWIKMSDADGMYYCCSECGEELYRNWTYNRDFDLFPKKESIDKTNYCPNCGAKMEEKDDRQRKSHC